MLIDLLQNTGLNKYEAEAYAALVQHGPLTGYELGKRSGVPLSRSYEILERLANKGLALVQPGDPPRYIAEAPRQFLDRTRAATLSTLDALTSALAEVEAAAVPQGFWVVRGQRPILAHANSLIAQTQRTILVFVAPEHTAAIESALAQARARGCAILPAALDERSGDGPFILLLIDDRQGLVGTLAPAERAQAVASSNLGFVGALARCAAPQRQLATLQRDASDAAAPSKLDWLDWEQRKQRQLLGIRHDRRIAS
jgi:sugar-specific transcriptional regulator TrmB